MNEVIGNNEVFALKLLIYWVFFSSFNLHLHIPNRNFSVSCRRNWPQATFIYRKIETRSGLIHVSLIHKLGEISLMDNDSSCQPRLYMLMLISPTG